MKHILATTILAASVFVALADEKTITEKARDTVGTVVEKTKDAARDTKDAVVDATRHTGRATLAALAKEIAEVKSQVPKAAPAYFHTRLRALDEQHDFIAQRLALFSPEQIRDRSSGPRYDFDQCVGDLEHAIDQAQEGVEAISKIVLK